MEAIGTALAVAGGDTALAWQWHCVRLQSRAAAALAAQVAVADAASGRHAAWLVMHTHTSMDT